MAIMIAVVAMPLFGVAGDALDYSGQGTALAKLQAAVNAGVLAGATSSEDTKAKVRRAAWRFTEANGSDKFIPGDATTAELCEIIKNAGIVVHAIAFEVTDAGTKSMLQTCATGGNYYDASDSARLAQAFDAIAGKINQIALSK
jgi:hypothetical protein